MFASMPDNRYDTFLMLLNSVVEKNPTFKSLVDEILDETRDLIFNVKDYYTISRDDFDIIVFLKENAGSIISKKTEYSHNDYLEIKEVLEKELYLECDY
ncbi:MAG: hypothetical protein N4A72_02180 [Bacteroidales bacterium]|jgi:hypothetical protein|nr:hypothetical protein [Bacteroidales bacterium]